MPGRQYIKVPRRTWLSRLLDGYFPEGYGFAFDLGHLLERWLPPFDDPAHFWWSSEYYWGALIWFYFLSHQSELLAGDISLSGWRELTWNLARLRALPWSASVLLTLLSGYLSLSGSQCLLYALMLMSPIRDANMERWTPYRFLLLAPFWLHAATWSLLPSTSASMGTSILVFATGALAYTAFTAITVSILSLSGSAQRDQPSKDLRM
jgi:hypothetical protein